MSNILQILKQSELFGTLSEQQIMQTIIPNGKILTLARKQQILRQDPDTNSFYVVLSGKIRIEYNLPDGGSCLQGIMTPGAVLGAEWILCQEDAGAYCAVAATNAAVLAFPVEMLLSGGMIDDGCREEIRSQLIRLLARQNVKKDYLLAIRSLKGLRERIVTYLLYLARQHQSDIFEIPLSRDEMAAILCVNRSCLSHELSLMERDGMLSFQKTRFVLHNPQCWSRITERN